MKAADQDPKNNDLSVERLLKDVQFSPAPEFRNRLHDRLQQQLSNMNAGQTTGDRPKRNGSLNGWHHGSWRWTMAGIAALCLVFVMATAIAPTVRAQVLSLLQFFDVQLSGDRKSIVASSSFTPLVPEEIPPEFLHFFSLNQEDGGPAYVEMRYFSQDSFLVIYETAAQPGEVLPQGEPLQIGKYSASMNQGLKGMVFLAMPAPQPWRSSGNGGCGGNFDDASGRPPQQLFYTDAIQLTWIQAGLHIELLTNLPKEEAFRLAASLHPVTQP